MAEAGKASKANGGKYCICPACSADVYKRQVEGSVNNEIQFRYELEESVQDVYKRQGYQSFCLVL